MFTERLELVRDRIGGARSVSLVAKDGVCGHEKIKSELAVDDRDLAAIQRCAAQVVTDDVELLRQHQKLVVPIAAIAAAAMYQNQGIAALDLQYTLDDVRVVAGDA